jgi:hypothetical protein
MTEYNAWTMVNQVHVKAVLLLLFDYFLVIIKNASVLGLIG